VIVQVSDDKGGVDTQAITVTVTNVVGVTITGPQATTGTTASARSPEQPPPTGEEDTIHGLAGSDVLVGLGGTTRSPATTATTSSRAARAWMFSTAATASMPRTTVTSPSRCGHPECASDVT